MIDTDLSKMTFRPDFKVRNAKIILNKGRTYLLAFESTFNGKDYFNIREIYEQAGEWCPGKGGIQVLQEKKQDLLTAFVELASHENAAVKAA